MKLTKQEILNLNIEEFALTRGTTNALKAEGINCLRDFQLI